MISQDDGTKRKVRDSPAGENFIIKISEILNLESIHRYLEKKILESKDKQQLSILNEKLSPILERWRDKLKQGNKLDIIFTCDQYFSWVSQDRYKIKVIPIKFYTKHCFGCGLKREEISVGVDNVYICKNCGYENGNSYHKTMYDDEIKLSSGNSDRENFKRMIEKFESKYTGKITPILYSALDEYFIEHNLPTGEEIRKMKPEERRNHINLNTLRIAMKNKHFTNYDDAWIIASNYLGWEVHDLSQYYDKIMEDYDKTQEAYMKIADPRSSSINTQYRLFKHLQLVNYDKCKLEDFKISTTDTIIKRYETQWKEMCRLSNIKYIPTFIEEDLRNQIKDDLDDLLEDSGSL